MESVSYWPEELSLEHAVSANSLAIRSLRRLRIPPPLLYTTLRQMRMFEGEVEQSVLRLELTLDRFQRGTYPAKTYDGVETLAAELKGTKR